jgi:hypothetical protein
MKTSAKTSRRKSIAKTELKANDPLHSGKTRVESKPLAEMIARYKAHRNSIGDKLFANYDLALVAQIAAQISKEHPNPQDAAKQALKILDACRDELSAREQKMKTITNAPVPVHALQFSFRDGVRAITEQKRNERAEEYFRKFLVSEIGRDAAAEQLEQLKRDGFTLDQVRDYERQYAKFRGPRRKKF